MEFKLKEVTIIAHLVRDRTRSIYTVYTQERGGPIITADTEEKAKSEFEKAVQLSSAIRNFLFFIGANKTQSHGDRMSLIEGLKERVGNIEYISQEA